MEQSPPGWYPDPTGRGRQRWWDGTRWTDQVHRVPGVPARPRWLAPVIAAGVVIIVIGSGLLVYGLNRGSDTAAPATAAPVPTVPGSPAGAGTGRTPPQPSADPDACTVGDPSYRASHPEDGRLHGGGLAMPTPEGWTFAAPDPLGYAFDVGLAAAPDGVGWVALGAIRIEDPYSTPEQASATITSCLPERAEPGTLQVTRSQAMNVPGAYRAHEYAGILHEGERTQEFRVIVADLHSPESLAIYVRVVDPDSRHHAAVIAAEGALAGA